MPRGPRLDAPAALHHVLARGIERRPIFLDDHDRFAFLCRLAPLLLATRASVYAWALVGNHVHLLLRTGDAALSDVMRCLLTGYAVNFNRRHRRAGHLFQNRFKSILVEEEPYFLELIRYIHLNPIRAGLVLDLDELDRYPWSGHAALLGMAIHAWQDTDAVLDQFGAQPNLARQSYRQFVGDGVSEGQRPDLVGGGLRRSRAGWKPTPSLARGREGWAFDERILGSTEFVQQILSELEADQAASTLVQPPVPTDVIPEVLRHLAALCGVDVREICSRSLRPPAVTARTLVSYVCVHHHGLTQTVVANALGVTRQTVRRGLEQAEQTLHRLSWSVNDLLT
jgi:REP element-mobilizing transposase RayT